MSDFNNIRQLIRKNRMDRAITLLDSLIPSDFQDQFILLANQFQNWTRNKALGLNPPEELRNRAVYGLLQLISSIELVNKSGMKKYHLSMINRFERDLFYGFDLLNEIKTEDQSLELLMNKVNLYAGKKDCNSLLLTNNITKKELENIISKKILKYISIYNLLVINLLMMIIIILLMPFLTTGENLFDDILHNNVFESNDDDPESDIDID